MRTLYLHIGTPKTATTSIQMFCVDNESVLKKLGYSYPILNFKFPKVEKRRNGHFLVGGTKKADGTRNIEKDEQMFQRGIKMIHDSFEQTDNVILSDENLWTSSQGKMFAFWNRIQKDAEQSGYQIKVIVYLRRQDEFANSWFAQQVKEGWGTFRTTKWKSFWKHPREIVLDYYETLENIASVVGKENIIVRIFERDKFGGKNHDIYSDFIETLGIDYSDEFQIVHRETNASITGNAQEIRRVMNSVLPKESQERSDIRRIVEECESLKSPYNNYIMLSAEESRQFMHNYKKGNAAIAKEYLHSNEPLFHQGVKEGKVWRENNGYMFEDVIRFFGLIYMEQCGRLNALEKEVKHQNAAREEALKASDSPDVEQLLEKINILEKKLKELEKEQKECNAACHSMSSDLQRGIDLAMDTNSKVERVWGPLRKILRK